MLFSWLRRRRRRKLLAQPFPDKWLRYLRDNVALYARLTEAEQARLRDDLRVFVAEKTWEGCGGLRINDEIKVTVAAQACLLVLGLEHDYFARVQSILVYPSAYQAPHREYVAPDVALETTQDLLGQAHYRGPVLLSWKELLYDGRHPGRGRNLVFHEFAHQLDMLDGAPDGAPVLRDREQSRQWQEVMSAEYRRLLREVERGLPTLLDPYGAKEPAEFFAVATECFFDRPVELSRRHPRLYEVLRKYYRQDPAARMQGPEGE